MPASTTSWSQAAFVSAGTSSPASLSQAITTRCLGPVAGPMGTSLTYSPQRNGESISSSSVTAGKLTRSLVAVPSRSAVPYFHPSGNFTVARNGVAIALSLLG